MHHRLEEPTVWTPTEDLPPSLLDEDQNPQHVLIRVDHLLDLAFISYTQAEASGSRFVANRAVARLVAKLAAADAIIVQPEPASP